MLIRQKEAIQLFVAIAVHHKVVKEQADTLHELKRMVQRHQRLSDKSHHFFHTFGFDLGLSGACDHYLDRVRI